jgi:hypothetical protein
LVLRMSELVNRNLNSFLLREGSSCPLKLQYHRDYNTGKSSSENYQIESKIMMRRVLGIKFPGGKEAEKQHQEAIRQTENWLKSDQIIIYGGVVSWKNYHARLPVVVKEGIRVTLYQIHGKVWKSNKLKLDQTDSTNKKLAVYIREGAFKKWLISKVYPELQLSIRMCFPDSDFRAATEKLFSKVAFGEATKDDVKSLFVEVDGDEAIDSLMRNEHGIHTHPFYQDKSFEEQLEWMGQELRQAARSAPFLITDSCKVCPYRSGFSNDMHVGCWESNLNGSHKHPKKHVFDLIGHGNSTEAQKDIFFQEDVLLPAALDSFNGISVYGNQTITIQQRRFLQLLSARGKELPLKWLKQKLSKVLKNLEYPLHFMDFEAATSAIPMQVSGHPYQPVFFQFSCHTLYKNGKLDHYQWIDTDPAGFPHERFVKKLTDIPKIMKGTIVQYSPFEKQALNMLFREFSRSSGKDTRYAMKLQSLIKGPGNTDYERFVDMNKLVRDYYYNRFMNQGLGLKQVLMSVLQSSDYLQEKYKDGIQFGDLHLKLIDNREGELTDPYLLNQNLNESIEDGSSAMHAWLHTKTPFCDTEQRQNIHHALKKYCSLDSFAMVIIFQEWLHLITNHQADGDLLIWG